MRLRVKTNVDEVMADLERAFADVTAVAVPRALNELRDQAQTAGLRKVADLYQIGPRTLAKYVTLKVATTRDLEASISVRGRGFPLADLQPRQVGGGVSVLIKGRRVIVPHAFLARMKSGHVGVFARGSYGGKSAKFKATGKAFGRFQYSRLRLSINEFFTFGPAEAFGNADVTEAMHDRVEQQAGPVLIRNIAFARRGK